MVNDPREVANIFNGYFTTIADAIGAPDPVYEDDDVMDLLERHKSNKSIQWIQRHIQPTDVFKFDNVTVDDVLRKIKGLKSKKSMGCDKLLPNLIISGATTLCTHIEMLINICIEKSVFPSQLKLAEITPLHKKRDIHDKCNYRPGSVLPCISKVFEGIIIDQLHCHFKPLFSDHLSGFRKGHSCQSVVETCKEKLYSKLCVGTVLTDLSKACDCLPCGLLISKLPSYGVHRDSCQQLVTLMPAISKLL